MTNLFETCKIDSNGELSQAFILWFLCIQNWQYMAKEHKNSHHFCNALLLT